MLSEEIKKLREWKFTASMAPALMSGNNEMLLECWQRAIGELPDPEVTWPMHLGSVMEPHILDWHEKKTGRPIVERGTFVPHPEKPDVSSTIDGFRGDDNCVMEAKACNSWQTLDDIEKFYTPQVVVQVRCREAQRGALLVMHGTAEPRELPISWDEEYEKTLWERVAAFMLCVKTLTPPVAVPRVVPPDRWRTIKLDSTTRDQWPNWGEDMVEQLQHWNDHKDAYDACAAANKAAKELVPEDVGRIECKGVLLLRNRANALSIRRAR